METQDIELNLNNSHCLYERNSFTSKEIYNVCNGEITKIPHSVTDILAFFFILGVVILVFASLRNH